MLGLKLNHVSKRGPWHFYFLKWKLTTDSWLVLKRNIHQQSMPPWQPFLKLLSWFPTRKSSYCKYLKTRHPQIPFTGAWSSNELQRIDCMTGYQESSPSNGCLSQYQGCWCPGSLRRQAISSHDIGYVKKASPGPWFNIKMTSYQHRKSHCGDKTILRPSYLHNGIFYTGKMASLYWIRALVFHEDRFQLPVSCQCGRMIENVTMGN